ncbi:MarR family transcriptional regulator (plasmid) [Halorussus limi]|uniref:MarR family transcriptional regulator n=1 Tax=Halorussus limi TaxID=2938695 RepID=A0A8U0I146_9EURY|nr:MarR family transcriptional regulator [Halorussus limi]UPV76626.1 MarR family transcriptional regulator [Halorussus limi]
MSDVPGNVDWENSATRPVLNLLDESNVAISPGGITLNLEQQMQRPPSRSTVTRAIEQLLKRELIEKPDESKTYYRITEKGRQYLAGDLDIGELEGDEK